MIFRQAARWLFLIAVVVTANSCGGPDETGVFKFCEKEGHKVYRRDPILISFTAGRWIRSDISSEIDVIKTVDAAGIVDPVPISLPAAKTFPTDGLQWELGGYRFTASPIQAGRPGAIIESRSLYGDSPSIRTRVVYTLDGGIESFESMRGLDRPGAATVLWVKCGKHGLHYEDIVAARMGAETAR